MYKPSEYNIEIKSLSNGESLFYNSFTGAVCVLDSWCRDILRDKMIAIDDKEMYDEEQLTKLNALVENGFLIDWEFNELNWLTVRNRGLRYNLDSHRMRLTVAPTMSCNFKCYYCYESRAEKCKKMSEETIEDLYRYVEKKIENGNLSLINISWYGGEPLLEIDTIRKISRKIIKICNENNIHYHADILTNGYLLTKDIAEILKNECLVNAVQIPIDGLAETYSERKGVNAEAFDRVVSNIRDICDIMDIHIRLNIDKANEKEIYELTKYLLIDNGLKEKIRVYLAAVKNYENVCNFMGDECFATGDFFAFRNEFYKYLYDIGEKNSLLRAIPAPRWISCGLSQVNGLVVDPEGYLYRCAHLIGHKDKSIGHLKTDQVFNKINMSFLNANYHEKCLNCNLFPICMGGCVFERMLNNNVPVCRESLERLKNDIPLVCNYLT